jgi:hypothetical protein
MALPLRRPRPRPRLLEHELDLIGQLAYAPYFLTVHDIVRFARSRGILCQGRGSAANSVVCYASASPRSTPPEIGTWSSSASSPRPATSPPTSTSTSSTNAARR